MPATAILGLGHDLPPRVVTNEDLAAQLRIDPFHFGTATGITRRHYAEPGVGPSDLAAAAARMALTRAGIGAGDVEMVVFATMTPDVAFPGSGCFLQPKLGLGTVGALDIRAQCLGFLFGLVVADRFVSAGIYDRVLLATGEVHSTALDLSPAGAGVSALFGDGAAAAVLGPSDRGGLRAAVLHTDATDYEKFWCEYPASRQHPVRMTLDDLHAGRHYMRLELADLDARAPVLFRSAIGEALDRGGARERDVAHYFLHYVHPPIALQTAAAMGLDRGRVTAVAQRAGHIAAVSLPLALSLALEEGTARTGDLVCLAAVGAGLNWGAALLEL